MIERARERFSERESEQERETAWEKARARVTATVTVGESASERVIGSESERKRGEEKRDFGKSGRESVCESGCVAIFR